MRTTPRCRKKRESIDANTLVTTVAEDHAPAAVRAVIDLHFERDRGRHGCDLRMLVGELLGNLIDNAIRYNLAGGKAVAVV